MAKYWITLTLVCAALLIQGSSTYGASLGDEQPDSQDSAAKEVNPVVRWNKSLLVIVRTPGAQPATVHPTRSFAIMHAAVYDAVNAIERTHTPYWLTSPPHRGLPLKTQPQLPQPMKFSSRCIRNFKPCLTTSCSNP